MPEFITFEKVGKTYKVGEVAIHALKDASFSIKQGEICVIEYPRRYGYHVSGGSLA